MFEVISLHFRRLRHDEDGVTLVEYGIALGLAVTLGTPTIIGLANAIGTSMGTAQGMMP